MWLDVEESVNQTTSMEYNLGKTFDKAVETVQPLCA